MEAVFGLVENDGLGSIGDLGVHFIAAPDREAVHENGVFFAVRHQFGGDAVGDEVLAFGLALAFGVAERDPRIGGDGVGVLSGVLGLVCDLDIGFGVEVLAPLESLADCVGLARAGEVERKAELRGGVNP